MDKLQFLARGLDALAGERITSLARWRGLLIFNYHRIGDPRGETHGDRALYSATQDDFAEQVAFLARHFDIVQPADLNGLSQHRDGRHVMITFDDGYRDNYELAFPVLKAAGVGATFFVTTRFLDEGALAWWDEIAWMVRHSVHAQLPAGPWTDTPLSLAEADRPHTIDRLLGHYKRIQGTECARFLAWLGEAAGSGRCQLDGLSQMWMTWDMVREMRAAGMTIGGHSVNHPVMARLTHAQQLQEIQACAQRLQEELAEPMRWFAYPVGIRDAFNADSRRALEQAGVEHAFSYYGGYNRPGDWDRYDMRRVSVESNHDHARFRATACLPSLFGRPDEPVAVRLRSTAQEWLS